MMIGPKVWFLSFLSYPRMSVRNHLLMDKLKIYISAALSLKVRALNLTLNLLDHTHRAIEEISHALRLVQIGIGWVIPIDILKRDLNFQLT